MRYRVLGTVEAAGVGGAEVHFVRRQDRVVWGLLLLQQRPTSADELSRLLWPTALPEHPIRALQVAVSRIRRALSEAGASDVRLVAKDHCYQVLVPDGQVDVHRFLTAAHSATHEPDADTRERAARTALRLWRGEPLQGLLSDVVRDEVTGRLRDLRTESARALLDIQLAAGAVEPEVVNIWRELHAEDPYRDDFALAAAQGMAARGRRIEAVELLRRHRSTVADDLGLDVAQDLVELERSLLLAPRRSPTARPQQLPPEPGLVGRTQILDDLVHAMRPGGEDAVLLYGAAGVGKTALALGLAHRLAPALSDGTMVVSARAGRGRALRPVEVLHRVLAGCGLPPADRPREVDAASAVWRTLSRERRLLVVLDDVRDPSQVRPLLAGGAASRVIVTAREPQPAVDGIRDVMVDPLTSEAARDLLPTAGGATEALESILATCGGLPLALRIVGARLAGPGAPSLDEVAAALCDVSRRLDWLVVGDLAVRSGLESAYEDCTLAEKEALDRLAVLSADGFASWALAALLGVDEPEAESRAARLCARRLLTRRDTRDGVRWEAHDLVLSFAVERWEGLPREDQAESLGRLTARAAHLTAVAASALGLRPEGEPYTEPSDDRGEAVASAPLRWLEAEHQLLEDLVSHPLALDPDHSADLVLSLTRYLLMAEPTRDLRPLVDSWSERHRETEPVVAVRLGLNVLLTMITSAQDLSTLEDWARRLVTEATMTRDAHLVVDAWTGLGLTLGLSGHVDAACTALRHALRHTEAIGPPSAIARTDVEAVLAQMLADAGHVAEAVCHATAVLDRSLPASRGAAAALDKIVHLTLDVGRVDLAEEAASRMDRMLHDSPDEVGRCFGLLAQARIAVRRGATGRAADLLAAAHEPLEQLGYRRGLARWHSIRAEIAIANDHWSEAQAYADHAATLATDERERRRAADLVARLAAPAERPERDGSPNTVPARAR